MKNSIDFDSVMKAACEMWLNERVAAVEAMGAPAMTISRKTDRTFKRAMNIAYFKESTAYKTIRSISVACLTLFVLAGVMVATVEPVRAFVWENITTWYEDHIKIEFKKEEKVDYPSSVETNHYPKLDKGWVITPVNASQPSGSSYIISPDGKKILYSQVNSDSEVLLDSSKHSVEEVFLKDNTKGYLYVYENGYNILIWQKEYIYKLQSYEVSSEVLIYLANRIE